MWVKDGMCVFLCSYVLSVYIDWEAYMSTCTIHVHSTFSSLIQDGLSPLYVAGEEGHTDVVDILLKSGVDPRYGDRVCQYTYQLHL